MASGQLFVASPLASAGGRVIASPFQFVTTGEDNLRVVAANSQTGVVITIRGRLLNPKSGIDATEWKFTPTSNRTVTAIDFPLAEGAVLNLSVFASAGTPLIGQTYVIVQLIRGEGLAAIVLGTLLAGYVTSAQHLAWPGSPIVSSTEGEPVLRTITGTTPGADAFPSETVPNGARWQLLSLTANLNAAAAGTNSPGLLAKSSGGARLWSVPSETGTVGTTRQYDWIIGLGYKPASVTANAWSALPTEPRFTAGEIITMEWNGGFGIGNNWTAPTYVVREWLEVN